MKRYVSRVVLLLAGLCAVARAELTPEETKQAEARQKVVDTFIEMGPNDVFLFSAYTWRGIAYAYMETYEPAMADFDRAIELEPDNPFGYYLRATLLVELDRSSEAESDAAMVCQLRPEGELCEELETMGLIH